ncbi:MAG: membrane lipoprotein lipid attachment site-containing protein, partial [Spirochaetaceae bacterium]|nr:membrane lipoprotein lipid attachment site-containing protein [Spirochaetaceae bacterium]
MKKLLFLICILFALTSCSLLFNTKSGNNVTTQDITVDDPLWETPLLANDLPYLQLHQGGANSLDWKFANCIKASEIWIEKASSGNFDSATAQGLTNRVEVDSQGWPLSLPEDTQMRIYGSGYITSLDAENNRSYLTGVYVLSWDGSGTISIDGTAYPRTTQLLYRSQGRIVIKVTQPNDTLQIVVTRTQRGNHVRNMKLWAPAYDGAGMALTSADDLSPGNVIGSLEPGPGQPETFWHPQFIRHMRENDDYGVIRFMGWLSINSIDNPETLSWKDRSIGNYAGRTMSVIDEGYTRHPVKDFKQQIGFPYQWIIDLCNILGKDAWIQIPHTADASFPGELARLFAGATQYPGLRKDLRVWIELSNEIWNTADSYLPQATEALKIGAQHFGLSPADQPFYGEAHAWGDGYMQGKFLQRFEYAWYMAGEKDERCINVAAGFQVNSGFNGMVVDAIKEIGENLPEVLAITTYFGGGWDTTGQLFSLVPEGSDQQLLDWQWGDSDYAAAAEIVRRSVWQNYPAYLANKALCDEENLIMTAYEGGQHVLSFGYADWNVVSNARFMRFIEDFQRSSYMHDLYIEHWALWAAGGGRTAALFVDVAMYSVYGYWGAKEYLSDDSEKWNAFLEWGDTMAGVRDPHEPIGSSPQLPELDFLCEEGSSWTQTFNVTGGDGSVTIDILGGQIPQGILFEDLGNGVGQFSGTATSVQNCDFVVRTLDGDLDPDYAIASIQVDPAGTSSGGILYFRGEDLPEDMDTGDALRWDPEESESYTTDPYPVRTQAFTWDTPLFGNSYNRDDETYTLASGSSYYGLNMYGGWRVYIEEELPQGASGPSIYTGLRDNQFESWTGHNETINAVEYHYPSFQDMCIIFKADQFSNYQDENSTYSFGADATQSTIRIDLTSLSDRENKIRFLILNDDDGTGEPSWYISEALYDANLLGITPYFQITNFNNNSQTEKGWAVMEPLSGGDISMPQADSLIIEATDFTDN